MEESLDIGRLQDVIVVGAGYAGSVVARELAEAGRQVLVVDRRSHIGGNAYDEHDEHGVLIHRYGPHIFHTNSERIIRWLSRFTDWRFYEHRVLAEVEGKLCPIPINRTTINRLYGLNLDEKGVATYLQRAAIPIEHVTTSEDVVLSSVGRDLCEKFFRGYTRKQWGLDLSELKASVASRIPTRTNDDDRYFSDTYQLMPRDGYTAMFERILKHPNIRVRLCIDFSELRTSVRTNHIVYTGPIDTYFDYRFGKLPYRSLRFDHQHLDDIEWFQPVGTVNYPNSHNYTRITEFKHLTGQECRGTSIVREFPSAEGDPYYPIPREENESIYRRYKELAGGEANTTFVGRLAQYKYYNMDQVVGAGIVAARAILNRGKYSE